MTVNIIDPDGNPVRNDQVGNFSRVGTGTGTTPPEQFVFFHPDQPLDPSPISQNETTVFKNVHTGLWCRLAPYTSRASSACSTQGVLCDQGAAADATVLTYTGTGLSFNGVPLVKEPGSATLLLSADPACATPGGEIFTFPPGEWAGTASGPQLAVAGGGWWWLVVGAGMIQAVERHKPLAGCRATTVHLGCCLSQSCRDHCVGGRHRESLAPSGPWLILPAPGSSQGAAAAPSALAPQLPLRSHLPPHHAADHHLHPRP